MKGVVFAGTRSVTVQEVPDAVLEDPTDVVVRISSSAICGTDPHMYDGRTGAEPGLPLGHEPLGVVEHVGAAVEMVKPGDRVVIPTRLYCGVCINCARGLSAAGVISDLARLVNPTGHLGIIGVHSEKDLHPAAEGYADGRLTVPWATLFGKGWKHSPGTITN
ncbi:MAG: alcohol dehydrogenase catalytic domain-containing protein [Pseudonocardia sp.]|nr:alcohol dehydrogenase catalytic domain-containing protein [Pseudonocardia sp.]